jgi:hypothetical protein
VLWAIAPSRNHHHTASNQRYGESKQRHCIGKAGACQRQIVTGLNSKICRERPRCRLSRRHSIPACRFWLDCPLPGPVLPCGAFSFAPGAPAQRPHFGSSISTVGARATVTGPTAASATKKPRRSGASVGWINAGNGASPALGMCPPAPGASNTFLRRSEPGCCNPGENTKGSGGSAVEYVRLTPRPPPPPASVASLSRPAPPRRSYPSCREN